MTQRFSLHLLCALSVIAFYAPATVAEYKADETSPCLVCFNDLDKPEEPDTVSILNCQHLYHTNCIKNWKTQKEREGNPFTCPSCPGKPVESMRLYVLKQPSAPAQNTLTDVNLDEQRAILADIQAQNAGKNRVKEEEKQRALADKLVVEQARQASLKTNQQEQRERQLTRQEAADIAAAQKASLATLRTDEKARQHRKYQQKEQDRLAVEKATEKSKQAAQQEQQKRDTQDSDAELGKALRSLLNLLFGK